MRLGELANKREHLNVAYKRQGRPVRALGDA